MKEPEKLKRAVLNDDGSLTCYPRIRTAKGSFEIAVTVPPGESPLIAIIKRTRAMGYKELPPLSVSLTT